MRTFQAIVLFLAIVLFAGCRSTAPSVKSVAEYKGRKLEYGSQGGITGGGTVISILETGQVFSATLTLASESPTNETQHSQSAAKDALALINEGEALIKKHMDLSGTGNMTYFLVYHDGTTAHRISWPAEEFPPEDVRAFTKKVSTFIQK
ncbi:hypothetical protein BH09BAC1_BH09BAC1_20970 [soil metagenome]